MIVLKTESELAIMREAGRIHARTLRMMSEAIVPDKTTTGQLDKLAHQLITDAGGTPSFLGYGGAGTRPPFPNATCISVNEVVVHGIPGDYVLKSGDIVGLDLGVFYKGYHVDAAWTFAVGEVSPEVQKLLQVTEESLFKGIEKAVVGNKVGDISNAIERHVAAHRYGIVTELVGHGIGKHLHEEPSVPNYGPKGKGASLKAGTTICIEPMVNLGTHKVRTLADEWTIVTSDRKPSAHFEHTVAITENGPEILTKE